MEYKFGNRPLTAKQKEFLMECHEREILNQDSIVVSQDMRSVKHLYKRGFVSPGNLEKDGKTLLRFYITVLGKKYLEVLNLQK